MTRTKRTPNADKGQMNIRVSDDTRRQISRLMEQHGDTQASVISKAIDRMYREEIRTMEHWSDVFGNGMTAAQIIEAAGQAGLNIDEWMETQYDELYPDQVGRYGSRDFERMAEQVRHEMYERVVQRIEDTPELEPHRDMILHEWPNWNEHLVWAATYPVAEIVDWAQSVDADADTNA